VTCELKLVFDKFSWECYFVDGCFVFESIAWCSMKVQTVHTDCDLRILSFFSINKSASVLFSSDELYLVEKKYGVNMLIQTCYLMCYFETTLVVGCDESCRPVLTFIELLRVFLYRCRIAFSPVVTVM